MHQKNLQYCLNKWKVKCKKDKKEYSCPNCRVKITTTIRSLHLDNLVIAIFRDANEELKKDREELIMERKGMIYNYFIYGGLTYKYIINKLYTNKFLKLFIIQYLT